MDVLICRLHTRVGFSGTGSLPLWMVDMAGRICGRCRSCVPAFLLSSVGSRVEAQQVPLQFSFCSLLLVPATLSYHLVVWSICSRWLGFVPEPLSQPVSYQSRLPDRRLPRFYRPCQWSLSSNSTAAPSALVDWHQPGTILGSRSDAPSFEGREEACPACPAGTVDSGPDLVKLNWRRDWRLENELIESGRETRPRPDDCIIIIIIIITTTSDHPVPLYAPSSSSACCFLPSPEPQQQKHHNHRRVPCCRCWCK